jgi:GDPmannose 4,6-dehydratase
MRLMVQARSADDYVVATGEGHSVRELCELAFGHFGMDWREHVRAHPAQARPSEPAPLVGNASKLRHALGWSPKTTFTDMVRLMVEHELERALRTRGTRI